MVALLSCGISPLIQCRQQQKHKAGLTFLNILFKKKTQNKIQKLTFRLSNHLDQCSSINNSFTHICLLAPIPAWWGRARLSWAPTPTKQGWRLWAVLKQSMLGILLMTHCIFKKKQKTPNVLQVAVEWLADKCHVYLCQGGCYCRRLLSADLFFFPNNSKVMNRFNEVFQIQDDKAIITCWWWETSCLAEVCFCLGPADDLKHPAARRLRSFMVTDWSISRTAALQRPKPTITGQCSRFTIKPAAGGQCKGEENIKQLPTSIKFPQSARYFTYIFRQRMGCDQRSISFKHTDTEYGTQVQHNSLKMCLQAEISVKIIILIFKIIRDDTFWGLNLKRREDNNLCKRELH